MSSSAVLKSHAVKQKGDFWRKASVGQPTAEEHQSISLKSHVQTHLRPVLQLRCYFEMKRALPLTQMSPILEKLVLSFPNTMKYYFCCKERKDFFSLFIQHLKLYIEGKQYNFAFFLSYLLKYIFK